MKSVLIITPYRDTTSHLFAERGGWLITTRPVSITISDDDLKKFDLVLYEGDISDVSPELYNMDYHQSMHEVDYIHDEAVMSLINRAAVLSIPQVGICKGAQLLCVAAGGKLHQHVTGHMLGDHPITTTTGTVLNTKGDHHQTMNVKDIDCDILATAEDGEAEVVYFPTIGVGALAVQYHPEWMDADSKGVEYFFDLIEDVLCVHSSTPTSAVVQ